MNLSDRQQLQAAGGSALDNAVIESWHSTIELELRQLEHFATTAQARRRIATWIEEYNHDRHQLIAADVREPPKLIHSSSVNTSRVAT